METIADLHKFVHKRNGGDLCTTGLYSIVQ